MTELINAISAGGSVAVPVILLYGLRYMTAEFKRAQSDAAQAHQQTINILLDVVRDNTRALQEAATTMSQCHHALDHRAVAVQLSRSGHSPPDPRP
ncbi:MAG: hypothetical protein N2378_12370 [Chloroflexaceae bacterium]|nr:hypothetical protein [Chloroflexaceae bacterium]